MNIRYYIDPEPGLTHIYGHDIEETEVEEVLSTQGKIDQVARDRELQLERHRKDVT